MKLSSRKLDSAQCLLFALLAGPTFDRVYAQTVTWTFTGSISHVTDASGVLSASGVSVQIGDPFTATWTYDPAIPPTVVTSQVAQWQYGTNRSSMVMTLNGHVWTSQSNATDQVFDNGSAENVTSNFRTDPVCGTAPKVPCSTITTPISGAFTPSVTATSWRVDANNRDAVQSFSWPASIDLHMWDGGEIEIFEQGVSGSAQPYTLSIFGSIAGWSRSTSAWQSTGAMNNPGRAAHAAALLEDGRVLVVGGFGGLSSTELYNPTTGLWTPTGSLNVGRLQDHTLTRLLDGRVLAAAGLGCAASPCASIAAAEIYDPSTGVWSNTGSLNAARVGHAAALLADGRVLVSGGVTTGPAASAEIYTPATGVWTNTGSMNTTREGHHLTRLFDGKVLATGGLSSATTELFDPQTGLWTHTGSMTTGRSRHTATLLPSGSVLVAGGSSGAAPTTSAERYNPATGVWESAGALATGRYVHGASLLRDGRVLIAGGADEFSPFPTHATATAEIYNSHTNNWSAAPNMLAPRSQLTTTPLPDGSVLAVGGWTNPFPDVEVFVDQPVGPALPATVGVYSSGQWLLDANADGTFTGGTDFDVLLGWPGVTPITGDWNGDGRRGVGVFANGFWYLDSDENSVWDGGIVDTLYTFGWNGVTPLVGDWNGDGRDSIGIFINGFWFLDADGDGRWDGPSADIQAQFGWNGVTPFIGDWNGDGRDKIGIFINGFWYLDYNGDAVWNGPVVDRQAQFGWNGVTPLTGDWNGDGSDTIGIYINGFWYLDADGDGLWDGPGADIQAQFGWTGVTPLKADWNGDGRDKIGIFIDGLWYLDHNGNAVWDGGPNDKAYAFGQAGEIPLIGPW